MSGEAAARGQLQRAAGFRSHGEDASQFPKPNRHRGLHLERWTAVCPVRRSKLRVLCPAQLLVPKGTLNRKLGKTCPDNVKVECIPEGRLFFLWLLLLLLLSHFSPV